MVDPGGFASPPDDGGHTGSNTTPDQTMVKHDADPGPHPSLLRDPARAELEPRATKMSIAVGAVILFLLLILLVFMPR